MFYEVYPSIEVLIQMMCLLQGELTDNMIMSNITRCLDSHQQEKFEILLYRKNSE